MSPESLTGCMILLGDLFPSLGDDTPDRLSVIRDGLRRHPDAELVREALRDLAAHYTREKPSPAEVLEHVRQFVDRRTPGTALSGGPTPRQREEDERRKREQAEALEYRALVREWLDGMSDDRLADLIDRFCESSAYGPVSALMTERKSLRDYGRISVSAVRYGKDAQGFARHAPPETVRSEAACVTATACLLHSWALDHAPEFVAAGGAAC